MKKITPVLLVLLLLSACAPAATPTPMPTPVPPTVPPLAVEEMTCISTQPTQEDVDRALAFTGGLFNTPDWERSYTVEDSRVAVTWFGSSISAVAFLEALIFPCGYEELDLDQFFGDENWDIIFGNYQRYQRVDECRTDAGLRLYQFKAVDQGFDYDIYYWAQNDTATRVVTMMIVLPVGSEDRMEEYGYSLFPTLQSCK